MSSDTYVKFRLPKNAKIVIHHSVTNVPDVIHRIKLMKGKRRANVNTRTLAVIVENFESYKMYKDPHTLKEARKYHIKVVRKEFVYDTMSREYTEALRRNEVTKRKRVESREIAKCLERVSQEIDQQRK